MLRELGLTELGTQSFVGTAHTLLDDDLRAGAEALLAMRWPGVEDELEAPDRAEFRRLCQLDLLDFIVRHPDYTMWFTYMLLLGTVPSTPRSLPLHQQHVSRMTSG